MSDATQRLIQQMLEQRERWVDLGGGKRVCYHRLTETEAARLPGTDSVDLAARVVIKWDGFTDADLLGDGIGGSDPAPFSTDVWTLLVGDRVDWVNAVAESVWSGVKQLLEERRAVSGNSRPSSTPTPTAPTGRAKPNPKAATPT